MLSMQSLPQGIQQFNLCSRQALPTSMYPWSTKDISFPEFNMDYSTQFQGNLFYEQQKRIKFLEDELKRHKSQIEDLSSKLIIFEQEKAKEQKKKIQSRYWTPEEHERFLEALEKYGCKDVKAISNFVGTRSATQVRTHAQKYFLRLEREKTRDGDESPDGSETKPKTGKKKRSHAETKSEKNRKCNDGFSSSNEESSEESTTSPESIPKSNEEVDTKPIVRSNEEISAPLTTTVPEKELPKTGDKEPPTMLSEEDTADSGDNKRMRRNTSQNFGNAYQIPFFAQGLLPPNQVGFNTSIFGNLAPRAIQLPDGLSLSTALPNPMSVNPYRADSINLQGHESLSSYMASLLNSSNQQLLEESNQQAQQFIDISSVFHSVYP